MWYNYLYFKPTLVSDTSNGHWFTLNNRKKKYKNFVIICWITQKMVWSSWFEFNSNTNLKRPTKLTKMIYFNFTQRWNKLSVWVISKKKKKWYPISVLILSRMLFRKRFSSIDYNNLIKNNVGKHIIINRYSGDYQYGVRRISISLSLISDLFALLYLSNAINNIPKSFSAKVRKRFGDII